MSLMLVWRLIGDMDLIVAFVFIALHFGQNDQRFLLTELFQWASRDCAEPSADNAFCEIFY